MRAQYDFDGEALGMHFVGHGACEMAGQAVFAIQMEAALEELTRATFPPSNTQRISR
jgi:pyruvate/2-oxoglutarate dehydrogenase complex dihydrolipoamide dehydrogenase (E3) component